MIPTTSSGQDVKVEVSPISEVQVVQPQHNSCAKTLIYIMGLAVWTCLVVAITKNETGC